MGTRFALPLLLLVVGVCCAQQQEEEEQEEEQTGGRKERGPNSTLALLVEVGRARRGQDVQQRQQNNKQLDPHKTNGVHITHVQ